MTSSKRHHEVPIRQRAAGFTLVELMIAMILGLLLIAGVGSVFIANKNAYRTNEALSQAQESARTSFEFLAREIREAGANPCGTANVASVLNPGGNPMLYSSGPIEGWDDAASIPASVASLPASGAGAPIGGGSAIRLASAKGSGLDLQPTSVQRTNVQLQNPTTQIAAGDILMICDVDSGAIFQVSGYNSTSGIVQHGTGSGSPGNNTDPLNGNDFDPSSYLAIPTNYIWYVGTNGDGGRSLYRYGRGQSSVPQATEMVRGVWGMTATYHEPTNLAGNAYYSAANVNNWANVDAVRLEMTVRSRGFQPGGARGAGTDAQRLQRVFTTTVAMRNRLNGN
jgi:type IV pilus assembly protein PilW